MSNDPILYRRSEGGWCDNCETIYPFIPGDGNCPSCGPVKLRPATVTVVPHDADEVARRAIQPEGTDR